MADSPFDTIVAPITGPQRAAVAIVRVSGPDAWAIAGKVFSPWPHEVEVRRAQYGHYANGDEGLALAFEDGHSYTGEQSVELSIHGSPASVRSLVGSCLSAGARAARPGEFTERAFLNGKMDLTQAEAVRDTVEASTGAQLRAANLVREGALYREVSHLRAELIEVLTAVEASTDFSEEIGELDREWASEHIRCVESAVSRLLATANSGRIMREGLRIAIVGPPNSGKSSLLNALLGSDRAIVTDIPGTTRDFVEEAADLGGVPCVLIDTAGLRESSDPVEAIGVQRSRAQAAGADLVWYVFDASVGWTPGDEEAVGEFDRPVTVIGNKADLVARGPVSGLPFAVGSSDAGLAVGGRPSADSESESPGPVQLRLPDGVPESGAANRKPLTANPIAATSALTGLGLPKLIQAIQALADVAPDRPLINTRHEALLRTAQGALAKASEVLHADLPTDLLSTCLQEAIQALGGITGEAASSEMLEEIFSRFCIGK